MNDAKFPVNCNSGKSSGYKINLVKSEVLKVMLDMEGGPWIEVFRC